MLTDIWCQLFISDDIALVKKLEQIRPLIAVSSPDDIKLFNCWALKLGIPLIKPFEL